VGGFPPLWTEWNGRYRDTVRSVWLRQGSGEGAAAFRDLGARLAGSANLYQGTGRGPSASVTFVTAHDGFTLADLVSHDRKHNEANGEDGRDGTDDNRSSGGGAEGPTDDPSVLRVRRRRRRALLATLLLSTGVPMLVAGDELGRTQLGNNNAYCQDSELSWLDWSADAGDRDPAGADPLLLALVRELLRLRATSPVLHQQAFFDGRPDAVSGARDIAWFRVDGGEMDGADWESPSAPALVACLSGQAIKNRVAARGAGGRQLLRACAERR
jgi:isoamylase